MLALDIFGKLVAHGTSWTSDDMNTDMSSIATGYVPAPRIVWIDGAAFVVGIYFFFLAVRMWNAQELVTMASGKALFVDIVGGTVVDVAEVKFEVAVVISIKLGCEIYLTALLPVFYDRDCRVGHEVSANHVIVVTLRIAAEAGTICSSAEIIDGIVNFPASWREV